MNNSVTGIIVGIANKCRVTWLYQIIRNDIIKNTVGIEIQSSHPMVYHNKINNNKKHGILSTTVDDLV